MYMYNRFTFAVEQKLTTLQIKKQNKIHAALHLSTRSESQSFHLPLVAEAFEQSPTLSPFSPLRGERIVNTEGARMRYSWDRISTC